MIRLFKTFAIVAFTALNVFGHAQKPALVQNIDERGRNPYQQTIQFAPTVTGTGSTPCISGNVCLALFKPVPAGYRLVVTQVSAIYPAASTGDVSHPVLLVSIVSIASPQFVDATALPTATLSGGVYTSSTPTTFYVEPGFTPVLDMSNVLTGAGDAIVSISGYLVALSQ
jgi:hypothetical protein